MTHDCSRRNEFCLNDLDNQPACQVYRHTILPNVFTSIVGFQVVEETCVGFIESVDIIKSPEIGTVEFDGQYLQYSFDQQKEGKDEFSARVCLNIENTSHCRERVWVLRSKKN